MPNRTKHTFCLLFILLLIWTLNQKAFSQYIEGDRWQKDIPKEAAILHEEAKALLKRNQYVAAIPKLERSLELKQDYYLAIHNLALAYALKGSDIQLPSKTDRQQAWVEFDRAEKIAAALSIRDPILYSSMGWLAMMEALFSPSQAFHERENWYKYAEENLNKSLAIEATTASALNNLGVLYELRGNQERSLSYYKKSAALQDARGKANYERLQLFAQQTPAPSPIQLQELQATVEGVARAMGAVDLKSLQYTGSGSTYAVGQSPAPGAPWPRFNAKSFTRTINYDTVSMRDEIVRTQGDNPPRGGGGQPVLGEGRQNMAVSGAYAWNQTGETTTPNWAPADREYQLWLTPHGVIKAAMVHNATAQTKMEGGKKLTTIAFMVPGKFKANAHVNENNLIEKVESWQTNPVLGDTLTETTYADYKAFDGVQFPTKITQKQGGFPSLDLTVSEVKPNASADIQVPDNVRQTTMQVKIDKAADGVWYVTGGSYCSVREPSIWIWTI